MLSKFFLGYIYSLQQSKLSFGRLIIFTYIPLSVLIVYPGLQCRAQSSATRSESQEYIDHQHGFRFQYPSTWIQDGAEISVIDLSGKITSVQVSFSDSSASTHLILIYHLVQGMTIYNECAAQFDQSKGWYQKNAAKINVAGNTALQANLVDLTDGRGNKLAQPVRSSIVDFLDENKIGEFQIQYKTTADNPQNGLFANLLSTFRFIEKGNTK